MWLQIIRKRIIVVLLIPLIHACGGGGGSSPPVEASLVATVTMPSSITSVALPVPGTVRVYINKQGDVPVEMILSGNSATYTYTGLSTGISATYEVTIEFDSTLYAGTITLATASDNVTLSSENNSIIFLDSSFDLTIDTDLDSKANLVELTGGTNPLIPTCVLDASGLSGQLGNCELDS